MDEATYITVSQHYMASFFRTAYSILKNRHDAEDALQQTYLNAWKSRGLARPGSEKAWMMRILINECYSILRKRRHSLPMEEIKLLADASLASDDTGLYSAIDSLPENLRTPFLLKYMEGMTEKEGAIALNISLPSMKNRLFRARKALQKILKEEVRPE